MQAAVCISLPAVTDCSVRGFCSNLKIGEITVSNLKKELLLMSGAKNIKNMYICDTTDFDIKILILLSKNVNSHLLCHSAQS